MAHDVAALHGGREAQGSRGIDAAKRLRAGEDRLEPGSAARVVLRRHRSTLDDAIGRDVPRYGDLVYGPPAWDTVELLAVQIAADLTGEAVARTDALPMAVGELVANAIIHRSYAPWFADRPITIRQYTNAVVIESPGSLPSGRVRCEGGVVRGCWSRNLRLASFLGTLGVVRQRGDGLARAAELGKDAGFAVTLHAEENSVLATLRFRSLPVQEPPRDRAIEVRTPLRGPTRADLIVKHLGRVGEASAQGVASALGLAPSTVRSDLAKLVQTGVVEQTDPSSRSPRQGYRLEEVGALRPSIGMPGAGLEGSSRGRHGAALRQRSLTSTT